MLMKNNYSSILMALSLSTLFLGCMEDYLNPLARCTDSSVIQRVIQLNNEKTPYTYKTMLDEESVMLVGINEKTKVKTCKVKVDYVLQNENNSTMLSMISKMPFVSDLSKNIELTYTIIPTQDQKDFIIKIID